MHEQFKDTYLLYYGYSEGKILVSSKNKNEKMKITPITILAIQFKIIIQR